MAEIDSFLSEILDKRGSDLHFIAGDPPRIRLYGDLSHLRPDRLTAEYVKTALYEIMPKAAVDATQPPVPVNSTITSAEQSLVGAFSKAGLIPKSYSFAPYVSTAFNSSVH